MRIIMKGIGVLASGFGLHLPFNLTTTKLMILRKPVLPNSGQILGPISAKYQAYVTHSSLLPGSQRQDE